MNRAYSTHLLDIGSTIAEEMSISDIVHKGVYTCLGGPNYETVAELKMLSMLGVDAVGEFNENNTKIAYAIQFNMQLIDCPNPKEFRFNFAHICEFKITNLPIIFAKFVLRFYIKH